MLHKICEALLMINALVVFILLMINHTAPWPAIACYWGILTVRNTHLLIKVLRK